MKNVFGSILKGKIAIVGIGNTLRRDDAFGPALIARLQGEVEALCIDAGPAPENYLGKIARAKPDTILIVDALYLGLAPGEYSILKKDDIAKGGLSTHDISPRMFIEYLQKQTTADIFILGVQPESVSFGEGLSDSVKKALDEICKNLRPFLNPIGNRFLTQSEKCPHA